MRRNNLIPTMIALSIVSAFTFAIGAAPALAHNMKGSGSSVKVLVECRLIKNKILTDRNINVAVGANRIVLSGTVPTIYQMKEAAKVTRGIAKGRAVVNDVRVAAPPVSDSLIEVEVMHRIRTQTPYTVFDWASAYSSKGVLTLKGWVDAPWYVNEYQKLAERVVGVKKVVNDVKFTLGYRRLAWKAVRLIYRENMFPGALLKLNPPVHVIAENDRVILEGNAGSPALGAYLADLVRYYTGAIRVVNNLQTRS